MSKPDYCPKCKGPHFDATDFEEWQEEHPVLDVALTIAFLVAAVVFAPIWIPIYLIERKKSG